MYKSPINYEWVWSHLSCHTHTPWGVYTEHKEGVASHWPRPLTPGGLVEGGGRGQEVGGVLCRGYLLWDKGDVVTGTAELTRPHLINYNNN